MTESFEETATATDAPNIEPTEDGVGIIYGDVGTSEFSALLFAPLEKGEYLQVAHDAYGDILCQIDSIDRKTDLSQEKAQQLSNGGVIQIKEKILATMKVIGYRDDRGLLQSPRTPLKAGIFLKKADDDLIAEVVGLRGEMKTGAYIGIVRGHQIPVQIDINSMVQKHLSVLAKTGGGKSYITGVIIEELMKHDVTVMIIDPHGEYGSMRHKGEHDPHMERFNIKPDAYGHKIQEFATDTKLNPDARPLKFTLSNLTPRDLMGLTNIRNVRTLLPTLKSKMEYLESAKPNYTIRDIIRALEADEDKALGQLVAELEYLEDVELFAKEGTSLNELIQKGKTTIINLKGTPPDIQHLIVNRLATALFELRKLDQIPPLMLVTEEAHNYCPQRGTVASSKIYRTIASEGRKFGLGMAIITQRAAKVDKNVLSQCNTQVILKVTNPNDLKAIVSSVEGLTSGMKDDIQSLPLGTAIITGGSLSMPLFVDVRPRETKHGGESVKII